MNPTVNPDLSLQRVLDALGRDSVNGVPRGELTAMTRFPAQYIDMVIQGLIDRHELEVQIVPPEKGVGRTKTLYFYKPDGTLPPLQIDDAVVVDGIGQLPTVPLGRPSETIPQGQSGVGSRRCAYCARPLPPSPGRPRSFCNDVCRANASNFTSRKIQHLLALDSDPCARLFAARQVVALDLMAYRHTVYTQVGGQGLAVGLADRILTLNVYLSREDGTFEIPEDAAKLRAIVFPDGRIEYQDENGNVIDPGA